MAGGGLSGLTSQTNVAISYRSDRISVGIPARPHTSERYFQNSTVEEGQDITGIQRKIRNL